MTGVVKSWEDGLLVIERGFAAGGRYDSLGDEKLPGDHGLVAYTDLEVDVVRRPDGRVEVVDEDDLARAVEMGGISPGLADIALAIARRLARLLSSGGNWRDADADYRSLAA